MKNATKTMLAFVVGGVVLIGATAAASVYVMKNMDEEKPVKVSSASQAVRTQQPAAQPQQVRCDDDNIVGKVVGGTAGGLIGNQIGSGKGNTAATIGGAVGGTLVGEEFIPTRNVTCR